MPTPSSWKSSPQTTAWRMMIELRQTFSACDLPQQTVTSNGPNSLRRNLANFFVPTVWNTSEFPLTIPLETGWRRGSWRPSRVQWRKAVFPCLIGLSVFYLLTYLSTPHTMTSRAPSELFLHQEWISFTLSVNRKWLISRQCRTPTIRQAYMSARAPGWSESHGPKLSEWTQGGFLVWSSNN